MSEPETRAGAEQRSRLVAGGYARACGVCGAGAVRDLDGSDFTCVGCGSESFVHRCPRCARAGLVDGFGLLSREITCPCGFTGRRLRWPRATAGDLDGRVNTAAADLYRRHGVSFEDAIANPNRRTIRGLIIRQVDVAQPRGDVYLNFEREGVLLLPTKLNEVGIVIAYEDVEAVDFLPAPGFLKQAKGKHLGLTMVDFTWTSGWFALVSPFGMPDVFASRYAVALKRIEDARRVSG